MIDTHRLGQIDDALVRLQKNMVAALDNRDHFLRSNEIDPDDFHRQTLNYLIQLSNIVRSTIAAVDAKQ